MQPRESITYLGHATVRADLAGARLLTDPVLRDHFDAPSLRRVPKDVPVLVPRGGGDLLQRLGLTRVHELVAGETVAPAGAEVTAVPAEHPSRSSSPERRWSCTVRARRLGRTLLVSLRVAA